jgi:plasmid replication initiation protein
VLGRAEAEGQTTAVTGHRVNESFTDGMQSINHALLYNQPKAAADTLFQRLVQMRGSDPETGKSGLIKTRWVSAYLYVDQAALVRIRITPFIIYYIKKLEREFTSYELKNVVQMTSTYAIRLYELLAHYKSIGSRSFKLADLRERLDALEKSYDRVNNFNSKVLAVAVDQINQHTDLVISFKSEKLGRTVVDYCFLIDKKDSASTVLDAGTVAQPPAKAAQPTRQAVVSLSIAENAMLKQLSAETGRPEAELLTEARAAVAGGDLFLWLDAQLLANTTT